MSFIIATESGLKHLGKYRTTKQRQVELKIYYIPGFCLKERQLHVMYIHIFASDGNPVVVSVSGVQMYCKILLAHWTSEQKNLLVPHESCWSQVSL